MKKSLLTLAIVLYSLCNDGAAAVQLEEEIRLASQNTAPPIATKVELDTSCGTLIDWISDHKQAYQKAQQTGKPLYILHLSGNLRNEKFT